MPPTVMNHTNVTHAGKKKNKYNLQSSVESLCENITFITISCLKSPTNYTCSFLHCEWMHDNVTL